MNRSVPVYQVDAFTDRCFAGNPAAVCPLDDWLPEERMQAIAAENNLSETAFFVGKGGRYALRWFTPTVEVDLCGHATLASAWVLFHRLDETAARLVFETRSGELSVCRDGDLLAMDLPSWKPQRADPPREIIEGLGRPPRELRGERQHQQGCAE